MTAELPPTCRPDKYLDQGHLQELFNDFNASWATSGSAALIFSSLVNSVRLAYKDPLEEAKEELRRQQEKDHVRQLAELERRHKEELESPPKYCVRCHAGAAPASNPAEVAASTKKAEGDAGVPRDEATELVSPPNIDQTLQGTQIWPADTATLYIFSSADHGRRDWSGWTTKDIDPQWTLRTSFKVFKFQEPGTVKIREVWTTNPHRLLAVRGQAGLDGWGLGAKFWAYDKPRPGTQRIWSGFRDNPKRGIYVKGDRVGMEEWEEKCVFWVPI